MRNASTHASYGPAVIDAVLDVIERRLREQSPLLVGLSGLQGSGKSTLAAQLVAAAQLRGIAALGLSLDDFYLGRRARLRLAREVHPLLATRGVPGTHDPALIAHTLDALAKATRAQPARLPRFDKGRDTRMAPSRWYTITRVPRVVVFEGWCVGVGPQPAAALLKPVNELERNEDADRRWRRYVNAQLASCYAPLWRRLDLLIDLRAPSFDVVARWRDEQERSLRQRHAPHAMSGAAITRFIQYYERLSRHSLRTLSSTSDMTITLDAHRRVSAVALRGAPRGRTARY